MDTLLAAHPDRPAVKDRAVPGGANSWPPFLAAAWRGHRALTVMAVAMGVLTVCTAVGMALDPRLLLGESVWHKPFKFAVSFLAFGATLAWLLDRTRAPRAARWAGWAVMATSVIEVALITFQAARAVRSHFNKTNPFDGTIFTVMGVTVAVLFTATVVLAAVAVRPGVSRAANDQPMVVALRWALALTLAGMAVALLMVVDQPTVGGFAGAHTVGAPDGSRSMALTGWSAVGGDLRIPHFVGLHALQALPLLAAFWMARSGGSSSLLTTRRLHVAGAAYAALIVLLTWQARRGQPLLHPDPATLAALGALVVVTAGLYRLVGRRQTGSAPVGAAGRKAA